MINKNSMGAKSLRLWLLLAAILLTMFSPSESRAQRSVQEPFHIYSDYIYNISEYHKQFPYVEFVYGNPDLNTPGFLIVVEPYPERAWASPLHTSKVSSNDFRVWIEAGQQQTNGWNRFGLFTGNNQTLQYLDIHRKNKSAFALYISKDELIERIPHGDLHDITPIFNFDIKIMFARSLTAKWPMESADPISCPGRVTIWHFYFYPSEVFLSNKVEWSDEAHLYMQKYPKKKYYFDSEMVWQDAGWYFNLSYKQKNYIKEKINDNHYVILTFWKDEAHTLPLNIEYFKNNLWIGGFSNNPDDMETQKNYVAYPHKGFDDWTLFVPWRAIDYWWKDGIKSTKDNHICYGYYTLTLSNDGKTPATNHDFDYSGWLSIDKGYEEPNPEEEERKKRIAECEHLNREYHLSHRGVHSEPIAGGCTRESDLYLIESTCKDCGAYFDHGEIEEPIGDRCVAHNMKEVSRTLVGTIKQKTGVNGNIIFETTVYDVVYKCQNYCCNYQMTKKEYSENTKIVDPPTPPIPPRPPFPEPKPKCPPHNWVYSSTVNWEKDQVSRERVSLPPYDEPKARLSLDSTAIDMNRIRAYTYISSQPVSRQQWLDLNRDNNYLGISKDDIGLLTAITYQEAYDLIAKLNEDDKGHSPKITFSLPTVEEMRKLLKDGLLDKEQIELQHITAFYVDSIEIYDGKGRLVPADKLGTAPEGAKVRVMVGCMDLNGQVKMVDISTYSKEIAFFLKAVTSGEEVIRTHVQHGRMYHIYTRKCQWCGKTEPISENIFYDMRYHKPLIND